MADTDSNQVSGLDSNSLRSEKYISLMTFRRSGEGVATPVWFAEVERKLYVYTNGKSGKVKRIRNSPRARIATCNIRGRVHGDWKGTEVRIIDDTSLCLRARNALKAKYGIQMWIAEGFACLFGKWKDRTYLEIK